MKDLREHSHERVERAYAGCECAGQVRVGRGRAGRVLVWLGALCLVAAVALTGFNVYDNWRAESEAVAELAALRAQQGESAQSTSALGQGASSVSWSFDADTPMPTEFVDGRLYVGTLSIPSLGLELPVLSEWSYDGLQHAPCRYSGSAYAGNMVIAAHNYTAHFGKLGRLAYGADVVFTDVRGNAFSYTVESIETLSPESVEEMTQSDWDLTLFTCTLSSTSRITVRCTQVLS